MSASDDGQSPINILRMPAHTAEHEVGVRCKSDGTKLSQSDRKANAKADLLAKEAAGVNRVPKWIRDRIFNDAGQVSEMAVWIARVTQFANHFPLEDRYIRDSSADSSLRKRRVSTKRKCQFFNEVDSATASINQVERVIKCPRLAAVRERLLARLV